MNLKDSTTAQIQDINNLPPPPNGGQWVTPEELEGLRAVPFYRQFLDNDVAFARFLLYDKAVHKNDTGDYFYYTLPDDQREFFPWNNPVVSKELTPLEDEFLEHMEKLEDCNEVSAPLGLNLVNIEYIDDDNVFFTVYSDDLQIWFVFEGKDYANISAATHPQLAAKKYAMNTFISPVRVKLDAAGNVLREVRKNAK
ncbi:MAG: hypothetical protein RR639_08365 [Hydrogenoanaerobacterium sp.]